MARRTFGTPRPHVVAIAGIALACAGCAASQSAPPAVEAQAVRDVYRVAAAKPVLSNGKVIGLFTLADGTLGGGKDDDGFESPGSGGACLVGDFSATFEAKTCSTSADCDALLRDFHAKAKDGVALKDRHAYCIAAEAGGAKQCWIRPGDYCLRSAEPLVVGEDNMLPAAPADPLKDGKPVRWLVHACLNGYDVADAVPGCRSGAEGKSRTWESPVLEVK